MGVVHIIGKLLRYYEEMVFFLWNRRVVLVFPTCYVNSVSEPDRDVILCGTLD